MTKTAPRSAPRFLTPDFNPFLFADVGTDRRGGQLSVVSALARLDLDAWAEAAVLARLPRDAAVAKLIPLLRKIPDFPQMTQEAATIAARLVALLPGTAAARGGTAVPSRWAAAGRAAVFGLLMAYAVMIGLQFVAHAPAAHPAAAAASVGATSSQAAAPRLP